MRKASRRFLFWRYLWLFYSVCAFILACLGMDEHPHLAGAAFLFSAACFGVSLRYVHHYLKARRYEAYRDMLVAVARASVVLVPPDGRTHPLFFSQAAIEALASYYERFGDDEEGRLHYWRVELIQAVSEGRQVSQRLLPFIRQERSDLAWQ